jgi:hypothetical protein
VAKRLVPGAAVHRCTMNGLSAFVGDLPIAALSKHRQSTTPGLVKPPSGYQGTVTLVILSASATCRILPSPTTEPGRRGWKRRLGSPLSAPHFFCPHRGDSGVSKPTLNMVSVTPATVHPPDFSGFPLCSSVPPVVQALLFDRNLRCGRKRHKPPRFAGLGST